MDVRRASVRDIPAIVALAKQFHKSHDFPFPFSAEHFSVTVADFISGNNKLCLVSGNPVSAMFMAHYGVSQIAPVRVADEFLIWATPATRKGALSTFVTEYERWAKEAGCQFCQMSAQEGIRPEAMTRALRGLGYARSDVRHIKKI